MLAGGAANEICFQQNANVASLLPSDVDGNTAPPAGEPNFYVELLDTSDLGLFQFHVDFESNPANSTFTGPATIPVAAYTEPSGIHSACRWYTTLDTLGDRLMFRLAYRNFGDHEALVVNHSVNSGSVVGARWYEIRSPNSTPTLFQQEHLRTRLDLPLDGIDCHGFVGRHGDGVQRFEQQRVPRGSLYGTHDR